MASHQLPDGPRWPSPVQAVAWFARPVAFFESCRRRYGKRFTIRLPGQYPFVHLSDVDECKQVLTAPPEVLHPGEGARLLEPIVGSNSLILLDEQPHLDQRRLLTPAFHGERIERLSDLVTDVAEREVAAWPRDEPVALHPRLQSLTLEIILRAVFGLDPGPRLDGLRDRLSTIMDWAAGPIASIPPLQRQLGGHGPWARFTKLRDEADALIFELIEERRAEGAGDRDDVLAMLLAARHSDGSEMSAAGAARRADDDAGGRTRDHRLRAGLGLLAPGARAPRARPAARGARRRRRRRLPDGHHQRDAAAQAHAADRRAAPGDGALRAGRGDLPARASAWRSTPTWSTTTPTSTTIRTSSAPSASSTRSPGTYTWLPFGGGRRRCIGASFAVLEMKAVLRAALREDSLETVTSARDRTPPGDHDQPGLGRAGDADPRARSPKRPGSRRRASRAVAGRSRSRAPRGWPRWCLRAAGT